MHESNLTGDVEVGPSSSESARPKATAGIVSLGVLILAIVIVVFVLARSTTRPPDASAAPEGGPAPAIGAAQWAAALRSDAGQGADLSWIETGIDEKGRPWIGAKNPVLELEEFVDFQCPRCCEACPFLQQMFARFPGKLRITIRHLPRTDTGVPDEADGSSRSCRLARAAICAGRQGRYWDAHDYLFHNRDQLAATNTCVSKLCRQLGLDEDTFRRCLDDPTVQQRLADDLQDARKLAISQTPTFVAEGRTYRGAVPQDVVEALWKRSER